MKLFLKGSKCESPKCPIEIRPYPPGEHGRGRTKDSEYLLQMREKQKCARIYGVLEKQFRGYYEEANKKSGFPGTPDIGTDAAQTEEAAGDDSARQ
jgi:small subunit ribosomal protein S4